MTEKRPLQQVLSELHEALESSADLDAGLRDELRATANEINDALDRSEDSVLGQLGNRLQEALERFEGKHPQLTGIVGRVADALSDLGI
jgi:ABC-type transporter Mla subunit MlaD